MIGGRRGRVTAPLLFVAAVVGLPAPQAAEAQGPASVLGRVLDHDTHRPVADAAVRLEGTDLATVSSDEGVFRFLDVPAGSYELSVHHVAYGVHRDTLQVDAGARLSVRVTVTQRAVELDPVVVTVLSREAWKARSRGTRINEITREEIQAGSDRHQTLSDVLLEHVPGVRVREQVTRPGQNPCLEFRAPKTVRSALRCQYPLIYLDGVRIHDPGFLLATLSPDEINRLEILAPSEAGARHGTGSGWGVLRIDTRIGPELEVFDDDEDRQGAYPWELEVESHPTGRAFATGLLGNSIGLGLSYLLSHRCMRLEDLAYETFRASRCGGWATVGTHAAVVSLPALGASLGARLGGRTTLSRGRLLPTLAAAATVLLPSYVLTSSGAGSADSPALVWTGAGLVTIGVPAAVTLADHFFREIRDP